MYIDGKLEGPYGERRKVSGLPTLLFTVSSVVEDIRNCLTLEAKKPQDLVYVLGITRNELGGSEYYQLLGKVGLHVPKVNVEVFWPLYLALDKAVQQGLVASAHAVTRGGVAVHAALVAMGGELGMEMDLSKLPTSEALSDTQCLYSESAGRFIITIAPENRSPFETLMSNLPHGCVGRVSEEPNLVIRGQQGKKIVKENLFELKKGWKKPFGGLI